MKYWWVWLLALLLLVLISVVLAALKPPTHEPIMFKPDVV